VCWLDLVLITALLLLGTTGSPPLSNWDAFLKIQV
jgi:hypothetical protein